MMLHFRVSVQLSVEPLSLQLPACFEQLPAYFYLITRPIQLDCFNTSVYYVINVAIQSFEKHFVCLFNSGTVMCLFEDAFLTEDAPNLQP